jgi:hypothetical protein
MIDPHTRLIEIARTYIGVRERGGPNRGPDVEKFQKAVDGRATGEPWCLGFIMYCLKLVDEELGTEHCLAITEHVMTCWDRSPVECRTLDPKLGGLVLWQFYKDGKPTLAGHAGLIVDFATEKVMTTVEGNTSAELEVQRDGDGVFERARLIHSSSRVMRIKGFIDPWPDLRVPKTSVRGTITPNPT